MHNTVSDDPLVRVFTPDVCQYWSGINCPSRPLQVRMEVLNATHDLPSNSDVEWKLPTLIAQQNAWRDYLRAGFVCGMFNGEKGKELRCRLQGIDDNNFRSAISEWLAAWVLTKRFGLDLTPYPPGRRGRTLEFRAGTAHGSIDFEVKNPLSLDMDDPTLDGTDWTPNFSKRLGRA